MSINPWQLKDYRDQPLHVLAGIGISLIPVPIFVWLMPLVPFPLKALTLFIFMLLSALIGEAREYGQHHRWIMDLDLIFWWLGSFLGTIIAFILITI